MPESTANAPIAELTHIAIMDRRTRLIGGGKLNLTGII